MPSCEDREGREKCKLKIYISSVVRTMHGTANEKESSSPDRSAIGLTCFNEIKLYRPFNLTSFELYGLGIVPYCCDTLHFCIIAVKTNCCETIR